MAADGRALMVYQQRNEQRLSFKVHGHHWVPTDYDGILLMMRPASANTTGRITVVNAKWMTAKVARN